MSLRIKTNLSPLISSIQQNGGVFSNPVGVILGKVYGVITTPDTPTKELYELNGGASNIGLIFYKQYTGQEVKDKDDTTNLEECDKALPLFPNIADYPLINETVYLIPGPSPDSQELNKSPQMYYVCAINLWNNNQANNPSGERLGKTYSISSDVRRLLSFEGDRIYQGRKGNGLRFGTTVKIHSNLNEWSSTGNDGDPITIITNGYITKDKSNSLNVEEVNKEMSSIYMTSTQKIPLLPNRQDNINPITLPTLPAKYINGSQLILNSDRVTLNSKKDEVMIFANTNVEISTNNIINLNSNQYTHINSPIIFLGTKNNNTPDEPVLLGRSTIDLLNKLMTALTNLGNQLTSVIIPAEGSPLAQVNTAGANFVESINNTRKDLEKLLSKTTFTS